MASHTRLTLCLVFGQRKTSILSAANVLGCIHIWTQGDHTRTKAYDELYCQYNFVMLTSITAITWNTLPAGFSWTRYQMNIMVYTTVDPIKWHHDSLLACIAGFCSAENNVRREMMHTGRRWDLGVDPWYTSLETSIVYPNKLEYGCLSVTNQ